jgi:predicted Zn-dependent protease
MMNAQLKPERLKFPLLVLIFLLISSGISYAQSIELDKKLGAENAELVEVLMGIYPDKEMTAYVNAVGTKLLAALDKNPFEFQFHIVDDPIPNAFALPGGYVYVTRGILSLTISEDELACIMGHEIIHVIDRHSIKQMRSSILPNMLELPGAIVGNVVSEDLGNLLNAPINTGNRLMLSSYSRKHETASDTKGIELASKAGYDPNAMADILERLSRAVEILTNEKEEKSYFDSHPYTPDRVDKINKTIPKLDQAERSIIAADFPAPLNGLLFGYNPAKGLFKDQKFLHPELNFAIVFPEEWETFNQPTTVGAIHEDRKAGIFVGLEDPSKSPEDYASAFEQEIEEEYGTKPTRSESLTVNNHSGYLISMDDNTGDETMYIHILWLKMNGLLFKLIGIAPKSFEPDLQKTARSLRTLTSSERQAIEVRNIQLVEANKNESLEEISARSSNVVNTRITALINGIEEDAKLQKKQVVKIVLREKYIR